MSDAEPREDGEYAPEPLDADAVAAQRLRFLGLLEDACGRKARVSIRFHGPGVEGVVASGRLVAAEAGLDEVLVEALETPTGVLDFARVSMDDVLYVRLDDLDDPTSNSKGGLL